MNVASSSPLTALNNILTNQQQSAHRIANANSPGFEIDLAKEITEQMKSEHMFKANVKAIKVKDMMLGDIIDIMA